MTDGRDIPANELADDPWAREMSRRLDGELEADQEEALARALLRDPAARRRMEACAAADRQAGEALRAAFVPAAPAETVDPAGWQARAKDRRWRWALRAAAVVVLGAAGGFLAYERLAPRPGPGGPGPAAVPAAARAEELGNVEGLLWHVWSPPEDALQTNSRPGLGEDVSVPLPKIQGPRRTNRAIDRHIFRVYDEADHTVYLLGVDRVRKTVHAVGKDL